MKLNYSDSVGKIICELPCVSLASAASSNCEIIEIISLMRVNKMMYVLFSQFFLLYLWTHFFVLFLFCCNGLDMP